MQRSDVETIRAMLDNRSEELSISSLARVQKKDYKSAHNVVMRLSKSGIVRLEPFGNAHKISLTKRPHPLIIQAEFRRRDIMLKNKLIRAVAGYFENLSSVFYVLLLFGSYAKGIQTRHSDIDIMFIVQDDVQERMENEIMGIASTIPAPLHISVFSETEFKAMNMSKEKTVGSEAINSNIILHGAEYFYQMIK